MLCRINYHFRLPSTFPHGDHIFTHASHHPTRIQSLRLFRMFLPGDSNKAKKSKVDSEEKEGSIWQGEQTDVSPFAKHTQTQK